jgi:hypothetical protein
MFGMIFSNIRADVGRITEKPNIELKIAGRKKIPVLIQNPCLNEIIGISCISGVKIVMLVVITVGKIGCGRNMIIDVRENIKNMSKKKMKKHENFGKNWMKIGLIKKI